MSRGQINRARHRLRGLIKKYRKTKGKHTARKIRAAAAFIRHQKFAEMRMHGFLR